MGEGADMRCPACSARRGDTTFCTWCGLPLGGVEEAEIRELGTRLREVDGELGRLSERRQHIAADLDRRRLVLRNAVRIPTGSGATPTHWTEPRRELSPERVRNALLWLGTALLALSALTFTAVAWTRLDDAGRAALLAGATIITVVLAMSARRRLPATGEALSGLAIALALIDWYALRRAGVASGVSGTGWWAGGTALVGGFALLLGSVTGPRTTRYAAAILFPLAGVLVVASISDVAWTLAFGYALLATGLVLVERPVASHSGDARVGSLLRVEASGVWAVAAVAAAIASGGATSWSTAAMAASAVLALGLAPLALVLDGRLRTGGQTVAATIVVASPLGALVTLLSTSVGAVGLLTLAALLAVIEISLAGWVSEPWRRGCVAAGCAAFVPGLAWASPGAALAVFAPTGWFRHAWTGNAGATARDVYAGPDPPFAFPVGIAAAVVFVTVAAAATVAGISAMRRKRIARSEPEFVFGAFAIAIAVILAPLAGGASVGVAGVVTTALACALIVGSAVLGRTRPGLALGIGALAVLPAIAASGWAAVTLAATVAALTAGSGAALLATFVGRVEPLRTIHLGATGACMIALTGFALTAAGAGAGPAGFAAATVATAAAVAGALSADRRPTGRALEWVGAIGFAVGAVVASEQLAWLAAALTIAVPLLTVVAFDHARRPRYGSLAAVAAVGATWAWLNVGGVSLVEAYTLPAALAAVVIGELALSHRPGRSMYSLGPAIALALGPTLALAVQNDDITRSVITGIAAFGLVVVGARRQLQAPLFLGGAALLVLGIDTLGPAATRLPRWVALAIPGVMLLWIGATFERRREAMREAVDRLSHFG